jgi:hypothetical protein
MGDDDAKSPENWSNERKQKKSIFQKLKEFFSHANQKKELVRDAETVAGMENHQQLRVAPLDQYPDHGRMLQDAKSKMRETDLTVAVEQVSVFLTNDGTLITFFQVFLRVPRFNFRNLEAQLRGRSWRDWALKKLYLGNLRTLRCSCKVLSTPSLISPFLLPPRIRS